MTIRPATDADVPAVLYLARAMVAESPRYVTLGLNEADAERVARACVEVGGLFVAAEDDDTALRGFLAGVVIDHPVVNLRYAADIAVYVEPQYRKLGVAARLVAAAEAWATEQGATEIVLGISAGDALTNLRTATLYGQLGYELGGTAHRKALAPVPVTA